MVARDGVEKRTRTGQFPGSQRKPRDKANPMSSAVIEYVFAAALTEVEAVLHCRHLEIFRCSLDVGHRHFAQAGVADHAAVDQVPHGAELLIPWHGGVDAMQLPQADLFEAKPLHAVVGLLNKV